MACDAAIRHVRRTLEAHRDGLHAEGVCMAINWWHPDTIAEALGELVKAGIIRQPRPGADWYFVP